MKEQILYLIISIHDFSLLYGDLPAKALGLVIEWAKLHQQELVQEWNLAKDHKTLFETFSDKEYFKGLYIKYGTLIWGEGEVDIAPEALYERATGKQVRYNCSRW